MSIKKIAEKAGVSVSTVSRILNRPDYRCSIPGLREKIWEIAMEMDYVPNEAARNLKKGISSKENKSWYVNVLITRTDNVKKDPFFSELLHIIESEIHEHNCILSKVWYMPIFSDDRRCRRENLDQIISRMYTETEGKSDGLVIIGRCNPKALKKLDQRYRSVVSVNRNSTNYEVDEVLCDGKKIAGIAVEHLISLGHCNIGYVGRCHNEDRYEGYIDTLKSHKLEIVPEYVIETDQTEEEGYEAMKQLADSDDCPTGIYCANDITAIGMLKYIKSHRNLCFTPSIIASDDIEKAQFTKPMLTTVGLPKEEMGRFALYLLIDRMKGGHSGVVRMELSGRLIERESCSNVSDCVWSDYII